VISLTEETKLQIIDEHPEGLWLVLNEETPGDTPTAGDLLCGDPEDAGGPRQPPPSQVTADRAAESYAKPLH
jgi:hypothetical protein